jgi:hypothetical protein
MAWPLLIRWHGLSSGSLDLRAERVRRWDDHGACRVPNR